MNKCKRLLAGVFAVVLLVSATACYGDTTWVMKTDSDSVPAGVYITFMMDAYGEAKDKIDPNQDMWGQKIDETAVEQWIVNKAVERTKQYIAANILFAELGMTLDADANKTIKNQANNAWAQGKETYEKNGIAFASIEKLAENNYKTQQIFNYYYDTNGTEAVKEEAIKEYFYENFAKVRYMSFYKTDIKTGEKKDAAALEEEVQGYITRINKGEGFDAMIDEQVAKSWVEFGLSEAYNPDTTDASRNVYLLDKNETGTVKENLIKATFEQKQYEVPYKADTDSFIYLAVRYDLTKDTALYDENRATALFALRGDDFKQKLNERTAGVSIANNDQAINRYSPRNLQV